MKSARSLFLLVFSRPRFFGLFMLMNKISLLAMNRGVAAYLDPTSSGEAIAFEYALRQLRSRTGTRDSPTILFDVGANQGDYARMMLSAANEQSCSVQLHLFEPSSAWSAALQQLSQIHGNLRVWSLALSDRDGRAELHFPWAGAAGASLSSIVMKLHGTEKYGMRAEEVATATLDGFCAGQNIPRIGFLKIDVEGYEAAVLAGAKRMLADGAIDYIQIEVGAASVATKSFLYDFWETLSGEYRFFLILNRGLVPFSYRTAFESFVGASNFLLERKHAGEA